MFELVAKTDDFYLIDKAPGVGFHREDGQPALIDVLRAALDDEALWPVHRLDKVTSGLLLFARSAQAARALGEDLAEHRLDKYYLALADSKPSKKQGLIKGDMEKSRNGAWRLATKLENPALTQFFSWSLRPSERLFLLRPRTGRTHQLRVAMKSLGSPILGDPLYYAGSAADEARTYLHAYALAFELFGCRYHFVCPPRSGERFLSEACQAKIAELKAPWELPWPK
jgi:tRNA pseudouridine32 synthase/23S rRNA pseudouridine746 synthase